jgi:hypothetical protein
MSRRSRGKVPAGADEGKRRSDTTAAPEDAGKRRADPVEGSVALPRRSLLTAEPATWVALVVGIAVLASVVAVLAWPRQRFDMVKTLTSIAAKEGAWDNPWDLQPQKIASLKSDLESETDPIKRLITQRELAQQYVYGGASEPAIALLDKLLADYGKSLPARDIATLNSDQALQNYHRDDL